MIGSRLTDRIQLSPNVEERFDGQKPRLIVLHYTGMDNGSAAINWLCNPISKVSCHYLIDVDGEIVQLVDENLRAWHAGVSSWRGAIDVNSRSIGIEIQNLGHASGLPAFPLVQMERVAQLCIDICTRWNILPEDVLAHSDVAPGRKIDPGEAFDWRYLFERGIGNCVAESSEHIKLVVDVAFSITELQSALIAFGYGLSMSGKYDSSTKTVVEAFQRHFRPCKVDGVFDDETKWVLKRLLACRVTERFGKVS